MRKYLPSLLLVCAALQGCGTLIALTSDVDNKVYGGVRADAHGVASGFTDAEFGALTLVMGFFDMPFSLVADTVLLPYTLLTMRSAELPPGESRPQR